MAKGSGNFHSPGNVSLQGMQILRWFIMTLIHITETSILQSSVKCVDVCVCVHVCTYVSYKGPHVAKKKTDIPISP